MRPSTVVQSIMPGGKQYIGWWGNMGGAPQKGVVQYTLSPWKQRAFAGALHGYLFNGYKRIMHQIPYFALPFGTAYAVYVWAGNKSAYYNSKQGHHDMAGHH